MVCGDGLASASVLLSNGKELLCTALMKPTSKNPGGRWKDITPASMTEKYEHYKYFMDEFAPKLIGASLHALRSREKLPETWLWSSLEAFGLVTLENYHDVAKKESENKSVPGTLGKFMNRENSKKNGGWNDDGLKRYRSLYHEIETQRKDTKRKNWARRYLQEKMEAYAAKHDKSNKRKAENLDYAVR